MNDETTTVRLAIWADCIAYANLSFGMVFRGLKTNFMISVRETCLQEDERRERFGKHSTTAGTRKRYFMKLFIDLFSLNLDREANESNYVGEGGKDQESVRSNRSRCHSPRNVRVTSSSVRNGQPFRLKQDQTDR